MDHGHRHAPALISRLDSLGVLTRLSIIFSLFTLAIQLAIPVAQIWHIAADHPPSVAWLEQHQSDQSATHLLQLESHRDHEFDDGIYCPVCQAFVYAQDAVDVQTQVTADVERSIGHLSLAQIIAYPICLYDSAPRAPPLFS